MLLKIKLDWENPDRPEDFTTCVFARVLDYQSLGNDSNHLYRLDMASFLWMANYLDVKLAHLDNRYLSVEFQDEDYEILNVPIASCEVVDDFPVPTVVIENNPMA